MWVVNPGEPAAKAGARSHTAISSVAAPEPSSLLRSSSDDATDGTAGLPRFALSVLDAGRSNLALQYLRQIGAPSDDGRIQFWQGTLSGTPSGKLEGAAEPISGLSR
jgi:hypothetical protein